MKYSIKVNEVRAKEGSNIKGFATVVFGDSFKITNIAILENKDNYVVYSPISYAEPDDNWLIGMEQYSEEYRSDLNSIWMSEMGLAKYITRGYEGNVAGTRGDCEAIKDI